MGVGVGSGVGAGVGSGVGAGVGSGVGAGVGSGVGPGVGSGVGTGVGSGVGAGVGSGVGAGVGSGVGPGVGSGVGTGVGSGVGAGVGSGVGASVKEEPSISCVNRAQNISSSSSRRALSLEPSISMFSSLRPRRDASVCSASRQVARNKESRALIDTIFFFRSRETIIYSFFGNR